MPTPAELWAEYQPQFKEAKQRDAQEQTLVFLVQPVRLGKLWIAPLTLRRVLYLEAYESPFVGGTQALTRSRILEVAWVLSPNFSQSRWRKRMFIARNYFIKAEAYAEAIATQLQRSMELMAEAGKDEEPSPLWVAQLVDTFAAEYGWGLEEILDTPFLQLSILGKAMGVRMSAKSGSGGAKVAINRNVDQLRAQYLKEANELSHV